MIMMTTMMSQVAVKAIIVIKGTKIRRKKLLPIISCNSYFSPLLYYAIRLQGVRMPRKLQIILRLYTWMMRMVTTIKILI